jgi:hypothetical protein
MKNKICLSTINSNLRKEIFSYLNVIDETQVFYLNKKFRDQSRLNINIIKALKELKQYKRYPNIQIKGKIYYLLLIIIKII